MLTLRVLGPYHPDTLATRHNLGGWLGASGQYEAAIEILELLKDDSVKILGTRHYYTQITRQTAARCHGLGGEIEIATRGLRGLYEERFRYLGASHVDTIWTLIHLADWTAASGLTSGALSLLKKIAYPEGGNNGISLSQIRQAEERISLWDSLRTSPKDNKDDLLSTLRAKPLIRHPDHLSSRHNFARWRDVGEDSELV